MLLGLSSRAPGECLCLWSQRASCAWALPPPRHLIGPWLLPRGGGGRLSSLSLGQLLRMSISLHLSSHAHTPLCFSVCSSPDAYRKDTMPPIPKRERR